MTRDEVFQPLFLLGTMVLTEKKTCASSPSNKGSRWLSSGGAETRKTVVSSCEILNAGCVAQGASAASPLSCLAASLSELIADSTVTLRSRKRQTRHPWKVAQWRQQNLGRTAGCDGGVMITDQTP